MICSQCKTRNPIGNKFCRECGFDLQSAPNSLAAEEAERVQAERREERVAELLAQAFALSDQEKPDEALPLVEEATALLPSSTSALTLLASLYERVGQNEKAIETLEKIIALNPDSAADQDKLQQLRRGVHVLPVRAPSQSAGDLPKTRSRKALPAWFPFAAAGATGALILAGGLVLLNQEMSRVRPRLTASAPAPANAVTFSPASPTAPSGVAGISTTPGPPPAENRADPFAAIPGLDGFASVPATPSQGRNSALPAVTGARAPRRLAPAGMPTLPPSAARTSGGGGGALPPLASGGVSVLPHPVVPGNADTAPGFGAGARIVVRSPGAQPVPTATPDRTSTNSINGGSGASDGSYIRIAVSPPGRGTASGMTQAASVTPTTTPPPAPVEQNPMLRAQSLQSAGRYREAVAAYQEALGSATGAAAGEAYQGIALSEQRLGNDEAARGAYRQAIAAYEAQVTAGRGVPAAQRGIASCRAALEVLGNG